VVCLAGLATFALWVSIDATLSVTGAPRGFDPGLFPEGALRLLMTATRVAGAVLVVPLMEELFWRSFLLRYLIDADFESVPLGRFSWNSFLVTTVLFGLEHHLFLAGMAAGAIYNELLYKTRSLAQCVLAHAVTNLALAVYVLCTGKWQFW
jgi:CAAX prenyl protease-like protein